MSQSFPSSNGWEPFSNSQQQHALGWRRPATKPALPAPPNPTTPRFPAISPWNHISRPSRTDPPSLSQPTPSPHDDLALSAAVTKQEQKQDTRSDQRYNALKTDIAAVDTKVVNIQSGINDIRQKSQDVEMLITSELKRVYDECRDLHHTIRAQASAHDEHVRVCDAHFKRLEQHAKALQTTTQTALADSLQATLSTAVEDVIQTAVDTATHRLTQHITSTLDSMRTAIRTSTIPPTPTSPPSRVKTAGVAPPTRARSPVPLLLQIHPSDEEYALRVANRKRPPKPASSSSYQEADSLDPRRMYTSDASTQDPAEVQCVEEPPQPVNCSETPQNQDSAMALFEDSDHSSESLVGRVPRSYPERGSCIATKSSRKRSGIAKRHRRGCGQRNGVQGIGTNCSQRGEKRGRRTGPLSKRHEAARK